MKKVMLILMLSFFVLELNALNNDPVNCDLVAANEWAEAEQLGLRGDRLTQVYVEAFFDCEDYWYHR